MNTVSETDTQEQNPATQEQRPSSDSRARSLANLRPSPRASRATRAAEPKGQSITAALRRQVEQGDTAERLAAVLIKKGLAGDIHHLRVILDRLDGDVRKNMDISLQTEGRDLDQMSDAELMRILMEPQHDS
jgi:hypothetical protein